MVLAFLVFCSEVLLAHFAVSCACNHASRALNVTLWSNGVEVGTRNGTVGKKVFVEDDCYEHNGHFESSNLVVSSSKPGDIEDRWTCVGRVWDCG